jgi:hypothetical protein
MSVKIGRNDPCPCGSGKKFKKCCAVSLEPAAFSHEDRWQALDRLDGFMDQFPDEDDDAFGEFWGERAEEDLSLPEDIDLISSSVLDGWTFFDRPLADGRLVIDALLEQDDSIGPGERAFLQAMRQSSLRVWEIEGVVPGASLTLRDVLENQSITVRERSLSQELERNEWLAARVIPRGASGGPEIELGVLHIPRLLQDSLREELVLRRLDFVTDNPGVSPEEFYKSLPPFLHDLWIGAILEPAIPELFNTDGEPLLSTRVIFDVLDEATLTRSLDACSELERSTNDDLSWTWTGDNEEGDPVALGRLELRDGELELEANSTERGQRGRELLESLSSSTLRYRTTTQEDLTQRIRDAIRERALGGEADAPG